MTHKSLMEVYKDRYSPGSLEKRDTLKLHVGVSLTPIQSLNKLREDLTGEEYLVKLVEVYEDYARTSLSLVEQGETFTLEDMENLAVRIMSNEGAGKYHATYLVMREYVLNNQPIILERGYSPEEMNQAWQTLMRTTADLGIYSNPYLALLVSKIEVKDEYYMENFVEKNWKSLIPADLTELYLGYTLTLYVCTRDMLVQGIQPINKIFKLGN